jgi:hypothetical protein
MGSQAYVALGFDPAPGVPDSVGRLVTTLSRVGNQLGQSHATLTRLGKNEGAWEGDAATGFARRSVSCRGTSVMGTRRWSMPPTP